MGHDRAALTHSLGEATTEQLLDSIIQHAEMRATLKTTAGRLISEAMHRGMSVREIEKATGLPRSTVDRWAGPFTRGDAA